MLSNIQFSVSKDSLGLCYLTSQKFTNLVDILFKRFFENKLNMNSKNDIKESSTTGIKEIGQLKDLSLIKEFVPRMKEPHSIKECITNQISFWPGVELIRDHKIQICKIISSLNWKMHSDFGIKCIDSVLMDFNIEIDLKLAILESLLNALKHNCFCCCTNNLSLLKWSLSANSIISFLSDLTLDCISKNLSSMI